jgi:hypothetical protein
MVVDYTYYTSYINDIINNNIENSNFKSNDNYRGILEHVSQELGIKYIKLIEHEFPQIQVADIIGYLQINDKYGLPQKYNFEFSNGVSHLCSPTSLRYVYHALTILEHYKNTICENIVEVGCGYGGLFLALCHFSKTLNIQIDHYYFVDLKEPCLLIDKYIQLNSEHVNIKYSVHDSSLYGKDINDENLFFVSNYCFTEISQNYRDKYISNLLPKTTSGFIIWQTVFGLSLKDTEQLKKQDLIICEEKPQTAPIEHKNYFVYF